MSEPTLFGKESLVEPYSNSHLGEWYELLSNNDIIQLNDILKKVEGERRYRDVYPEADNVLRIFAAVPPQKVKVVILGQDPYHDGNANGFAFGCALQESPSLRQIKEGLKSCGYSVDKTFDNTLENWVKEGVFLLNTKLSVFKGSPNSHNFIGWDKFIEATIRILKENNPNVVYVLLGTNAAVYSSLIGEDAHIIKETHPASASYNNTKWKTDLFLKINSTLEKSGIKPVSWVIQTQN